MGRISQLLITLAVTSVVCVSCATSTNERNIPQPPQTKIVSGDETIVLPQIGKTGSNSISESQAELQNESQPSKFKTITEQKGPGGAVNRVNVDNPDGGLPDYYLTPNNNVPQTTNNNPDKLSTPNWQFSW
ncbi:MAG: hypothetical protein EKK57_06435 [Proteobacteria bacterium]|nr:MAG: hypothetical protein EKK57_06435 [Pseudomonadota bacterium]